MGIDESLAHGHQGWKSLCQGTGADFYGKIMIADAITIRASRGDDEPQFHPGTRMSKIFTMSFSSVYPRYLAKVERNG